MTKAIAKNNPVDTATMEKFLVAKTHVGYKHNAAGAKIWYELDLAQIGDTKISKATAAELLKNGFGLTIETYLVAQEQWIAQEIARAATQIAEDDRNEILSTPLVSTEAQDEAVKGEYANCARASLLAFAAMAPSINAELKKVLAKEGRLVQTVIEETDGSEDDADEETIAAVIPTEDNDYDETDEPEILNADLFVNLYHSPMQERYASVTRTINGEQLHFSHHRLTHISAPALDLEVYFDNGRMNFWHGSKRIARDKVWQVPIIKETTKAQTESFGKFFAGDHTSKFFKVSVYPTFADGSEHNYVRYFDFFNQAQKFVEEVKTFVDDVPTQIYITHNVKSFYTNINGIENYTLPAVDAAQAQSRLDELNKAIADNESFADTCDEETASKLRVANYRNKRSIGYYETALRMTEPATNESRPAFEDSKVYVLHARDIIGKPDPQLYKVKRIKMFGKKFLTIFDYIERLNKFSDDAERYQIRTTSEGEYIEGVYVPSDGLYHRLYAKDITDDPTIAPPVDTQTNQPTDFTTKLAELKAQADAAKKTAEEAKAALVEAQKIYAEAENARVGAELNYQYLGREIANTLTAHNLPYCELDVKTQTGFSWIIHTDAIKVSFDEDKFKLHCNISEGDFHLGSYDTPEQVTAVIERLKAAIARGDDKFSFAPDDEPAKFQVGATYAGKIPTNHVINGIAQSRNGVITVTKQTKCFVFYTMSGSKYSFQTRLHTDGKTEFIKDEFGTFVKASDLVKEMIA